MKDSKVIWRLKTPGNEFIEYDEPMNMDWSVCSKTKFIEYTALEELQENCISLGLHESRMAALSDEFVKLGDKLTQAMIAVNKAQDKITKLEAELEKYRSEK